MSPCEVLYIPKSVIYKKKTQCLSQHFNRQLTEPRTCLWGYPCIYKSRRSMVLARNSTFFSGQTNNHCQVLPSRRARRPPRSTGISPASSCRRCRGPWSSPSTRRRYRCCRRHPRRRWSWPHQGRSSRPPSPSPPSRYRRPPPRDPCSEITEGSIKHRLTWISSIFGGNIQYH